MASVDNTHLSSHSWNNHESPTHANPATPVHLTLVSEHWIGSRSSSEISYFQVLVEPSRSSNVTSCNGPKCQKKPNQNLPGNRGVRNWYSCYALKSPSTKQSISGIPEQSNLNAQSSTVFPSTKSSAHPPPQFFCESPIRKLHAMCKSHCPSRKSILLPPQRHLSLTVLQQSVRTRILVGRGVSCTLTNPMSAAFSLKH